MNHIFDIEFRIFVIILFIIEARREEKKNFSLKMKMMPDRPKLRILDRKILF